MNKNNQNNLVFIRLVLDQICQQIFIHSQRTSAGYLTNRIYANCHHLTVISFCNEIIGDCFKYRLNSIRWCQLMWGNSGEPQDFGNLSLVWVQESEQEWMVVEKEQWMNADKAWYKIKDWKFHFEAFVCCLHQFEKLLGKVLWVVD